MTNAPSEREELELLASRQVDQDLSAEERSRLENGLAREPALRETLRGFQSLGTLLRRWSERRVPEVREEFCKEVLATIEASGASDEDEEVGALLSRWGAKTVSFDAERYTASVIERLRPVVRGRTETQTAERRPRSVPRTLVFRLRVPLAAAASIALAFTAYLTVVARSRTVCDVRIASAIEALEGPQGGTRVASVSFRRDDPAVTGKADSRGGPSFLAISAGSTGGTWGAVEPPS